MLEEVRTSRAIIIYKQGAVTAPSLFVRGDGVSSDQRAGLYDASVLQLQVRAFPQKVVSSCRMKSFIPLKNVNMMPIRLDWG